MQIKYCVLLTCLYVSDSEACMCGIIHYILSHFSNIALSCLSYVTGYDIMAHICIYYVSKPTERHIQK